MESVSQLAGQWLLSNLFPELRKVSAAEGKDDADVKSGSSTCESWESNFSEGAIIVKGLRLARGDCQSLGLPTWVSHAKVNRMELKVPVFQLLEEPLEIELTGVTLTKGFNAGHSGQEDPPSVWKGLKRYVVTHAAVTINDLTIKGKHLPIIKIASASSVAEPSDPGTTTADATTDTLALRRLRCSTLRVESVSNQEEKKGEDQKATGRLLAEFKTVTVQQRKDEKNSGRGLRHGLLIIAETGQVFPTALGEGGEQRSLRESVGEVFDFAQHSSFRVQKLVVPIREARSSRSEEAPSGPTMKLECRDVEAKIITNFLNAQSECVATAQSMSAVLLQKGMQRTLGGGFRFMSALSGAPIAQDGRSMDGKWNGSGQDGGAKQGLINESTIPALTLRIADSIRLPIRMTAWMPDVRLDSATVTTLARLCGFDRSYATRRASQTPLDITVELQRPRVKWDPDSVGSGKWNKYNSRASSILFTSGGGDSAGGASQPLGPRAEVKDLSLYLIHEEGAAGIQLTKNVHMMVSTSSDASDKRRGSDAVLDVAIGPMDFTVPRSRVAACADILGFGSSLENAASNAQVRVKLGQTRMALQDDAGAGDARASLALILPSGASVFQSKLEAPVVRVSVETKPKRAFDFKQRGNVTEEPQQYLFEAAKAVVRAGAVECDDAVLVWDPAALRTLSRICPPMQGLYGQDRDLFEVRCPSLRVLSSADGIEGKFSKVEARLWQNAALVLSAAGLTATAPGGRVWLQPSDRPATRSAEASVRCDRAPNGALTVRASWIEVSPFGGDATSSSGPNGVASSSSASGVDAEAGGAEADRWRPPRGFLQRPTGMAPKVAQWLRSVVGTRTTLVLSDCSVLLPIQGATARLRLHEATSPSVSSIVHLITAQGRLDAGSALSFEAKAKAKVSVELEITESVPESEGQAIVQAVEPVFVQTSMVLESASAVSSAVARPGVDSKATGGLRCFVTAVAESALRMAVNTARLQEFGMSGMVELRKALGRLGLDWVRAKARGPEAMVLVRRGSEGLDSADSDHDLCSLQCETYALDAQLASRGAEFFKGSFERGSFSALSTASKRLSTLFRVKGVRVAREGDQKQQGPGFEWALNAMDRAGEAASGRNLNVLCRGLYLSAIKTGYSVFPAAWAWVEALLGADGAGRWALQVSLVDSDLKLPLVLGSGATEKDAPARVHVVGTADLALGAGAGRVDGRDGYSLKVDAKALRCEIQMRKGPRAAGHGRAVALRRVEFQACHLVNFSGFSLSYDARRNILSVKGESPVEIEVIPGRNAGGLFNYALQALAGSTTAPNMYASGLERWIESGCEVGDGKGGLRFDESVLWLGGACTTNASNASSGRIDCKLSCVRIIAHDPDLGHELPRAQLALTTFDAQAHTARDGSGQLNVSSRLEARHFNWSFNAWEPVLEPTSGRISIARGVDQSVHGSLTFDEETAFNFSVPIFDNLMSLFDAGGTGMRGSTSRYKLRNLSGGTLFYWNSSHRRFAVRHGEQKDIQLPRRDFVSRCPFIDVKLEGTHRAIERLNVHTEGSAVYRVFGKHKVYSLMSTTVCVSGVFLVTISSCVEICNETNLILDILCARRGWSGGSGGGMPDGKKGAIASQGSMLTNAAASNKPDTFRFIARPQSKVYMPFYMADKGSFFVRPVAKNFAMEMEEAHRDLACAKGLVSAETYLDSGNLDQSYCTPIETDLIHSDPETILRPVPSSSPFQNINGVVDETACLKVTSTVSQMTAPQAEAEDGVANVRSFTFTVPLKIENLLYADLEYMILYALPVSSPPRVHRLRRGEADDVFVDPLRREDACIRVRVPGSRWSRPIPIAELRAHEGQARQVAVPPSGVDNGNDAILDQTAAPTDALRARCDLMLGDCADSRGEDGPSRLPEASAVATTTETGSSPGGASENQHVLVELVAGEEIVLGEPADAHIVVYSTFWLTNDFHHTSFQVRVAETSDVVSLFARRSACGTPRLRMAEFPAANKPLQLRAFKSLEWSKTFSVDTAQDAVTVVSVPLTLHGRPSASLVNLHVERCPGRFHRTRLLRVLPSIVLVNRVPDTPLFVRPAGLAREEGATMLRPLADGSTETDPDAGSALIPRGAEWDFLLPSGGSRMSDAQREGAIEISFTRSGKRWSNTLAVLSKQFNAQYALIQYTSTQGEATPLQADQADQGVAADSKGTESQQHSDPENQEPVAADGAGPEADGGDAVAVDSDAKEGLERVGNDNDSGDDDAKVGAGGTDAIRSAEDAGTSTTVVDPVTSSSSIGTPRERLGIVAMTWQQSGCVRVVTFRKVSREIEDFMLSAINSDSDTRNVRWPWVLKESREKIQSNINKVERALRTIEAKAKVLTAELRSAKPRTAHNRSFFFPQREKSEEGDLRLTVQLSKLLHLSGLPVRSAPPPGAVLCRVDVDGTSSRDKSSVRMRRVGRGDDAEWLAEWDASEPIHIYYKRSGEHLLRRPRLVLSLFYTGPGTHVRQPVFMGKVKIDLSEVPLNNKKHFDRHIRLNGVQSHRKTGLSMQSKAVLYFKLIQKPKSEAALEDLLQIASEKNRKLEQLKQERDRIDSQMSHTHSEELTALTTGGGGSTAQEQVVKSGKFELFIEDVQGVGLGTAAAVSQVTLKVYYGKQHHESRLQLGDKSRFKFDYSAEDAHCNLTLSMHAHSTLIGAAELSPAELAKHPRNLLIRKWYRFDVGSDAKNTPAALSSTDSKVSGRGSDAAGPRALISVRWTSFERSPQNRVDLCLKAPKLCISLIDGPSEVALLSAWDAVVDYSLVVPPDGGSHGETPAKRVFWFSVRQVQLDNNIVGPNGASDSEFPVVLRPTPRENIMSFGKGKSTTLIPAAIRVCAVEKIFPKSSKRRVMGRRWHGVSRTFEYIGIAIAPFDLMLDSAWVEKMTVLLVALEGVADASVRVGSSGHISRIFFSPVDSTCFVRGARRSGGSTTEHVESSVFDLYTGPKPARIHFERFHVPPVCMRLSVRRGPKNGDLFQVPSCDDPLVMFGIPPDFKKLSIDLLNIVVSEADFVQHYDAPEDLWDYFIDEFTQRVNGALKSDRAKRPSREIHGQVAVRTNQKGSPMTTSASHFSFQGIRLPGSFANSASDISEIRMPEERASVTKASMNAAAALSGAVGALGGVGGIGLSPSAAALTDGKDSKSKEGALAGIKGIFEDLRLAVFKNNSWFRKRSENKARKRRTSIVSRLNSRLRNIATPKRKPLDSQRVTMSDVVLSSLNSLVELESKLKVAPSKAPRYRHPRVLPPGPIEAYNSAAARMGVVAHCLSRAAGRRVLKAYELQSEGHGRAHVLFLEARLIVVNEERQVGRRTYTPVLEESLSRIVEIQSRGNQLVIVRRTMPDRMDGVPRRGTLSTPLTVALAGPVEDTQLRQMQGELARLRERALGNETKKSYNEEAVAPEPERIHSVSHPPVANGPPSRSFAKLERAGSSEKSNGDDLLRPEEEQEDKQGGWFASTRSSEQLMALRKKLLEASQAIRARPSYDIGSSESASPSATVCVRVMSADTHSDPINIFNTISVRVALRFPQGANIALGKTHAKRNTSEPHWTKENSFEAPVAARPPHWPLLVVQVLDAGEVESATTIDIFRQLVPRSMRRRSGKNSLFVGEWSTRTLVLPLLRGKDVDRVVLEIKIDIKSIFGADIISGRDRGQYEIPGPLADSVFFATRMSPDTPVHRITPDARRDLALERHLSDMGVPVSFECLDDALAMSLDYIEQLKPPLISARLLHNLVAAFEGSGPTRTKKIRSAIESGLNPVACRILETAMTMLTFVWRQRPNAGRQDAAIRHAFFLRVAEALLMNRVVRNGLETRLARIRHERKVCTEVENLAHLSQALDRDYGMSSGAAVVKSWLALDKKESTVDTPMCRMAEFLVNNFEAIHGDDESVDDDTTPSAANDGGEPTESTRPSRIIMAVGAAAARVAQQRERAQRERVHLEQKLKRLSNDELDARQAAMRPEMEAAARSLLSLERERLRAALSIEIANLQAQQRALWRQDEERQAAAERRRIDILAACENGLCVLRVFFLSSTVQERDMEDLFVSFKYGRESLGRVKSVGASESQAFWSPRGVYLTLSAKNRSGALQMKLVVNRETIAEAKVGLLNLLQHCGPEKLYPFNLHRRGKSGKRGEDIPVTLLAEIASWRHGMLTALGPNTGDLESPVASPRRVLSGINTLAVTHNNSHSRTLARSPTSIGGSEGRSGSLSRLKERKQGRTSRDLFESNFGGADQDTKEPPTAAGVGDTDNLSSSAEGSRSRRNLPAPAYRAPVAPGASGLRRLGGPSRGLVFSPKSAMHGGSLLLSDQPAPDSTQDIVARIETCRARLWKLNAEAVILLQVKQKRAAAANAARRPRVSPLQAGVLRPGIAAGNIEFSNAPTPGPSDGSKSAAQHALSSEVQVRLEREIAALRAQNHVLVMRVREIEGGAGPAASAVVTPARDPEALAKTRRQRIEEAKLAIRKLELETKKLRYEGDRRFEVGEKMGRKRELDMLKDATEREKKLKIDVAFLKREKETLKHKLQIEEKEKVERMKDMDQLDNEVKSLRKRLQDGMEDSQRTKRVANLLQKKLDRRDELKRFEERSGTVARMGVWEALQQIDVMKSRIAEMGLYRGRWEKLHNGNIRLRAAIRAFETNESRLLDEIEGLKVQIRSLKMANREVLALMEREQASKSAGLFQVLAVLQQVEQLPVAQTTK